MQLLISQKIASGGAVTINAGWEFRNTSGYVTTLTGDIFFGGNSACAGTNCYPVTSTIGGFSTTYGWKPQFTDSSFGPVCTGTATALDRNSGIDARLAGIVGQAGECIDFGILLPSTGSYDIILAMGDANSSQGPMTFDLYDGTSLLTNVISAVTPGAGQWYDAGGTLRTSASNWVTNGSTVKLTATFTTTHFALKITGTTAYISYLHITNH